MQCEHVAWGWMRQLLVLNGHEAPLKINCQIKHKGKEDQNTATYDVVNFFDVDVSFVARSICRKLWPQFVQYPHYLFEHVMELSAFTVRQSMIRQAVWD